MKKRMTFFGCLMLLCLLAVLLWERGIIHLNNPSRQLFPIRGVDVSSYQGAIDWPLLSRQGIDFAFIKATEGSTHVDRYFQAHFAAALETGLIVGAYHFFSFDSNGDVQAAHFIQTVPNVPGMLPPVADVEFYAGYFNAPPPAEKVQTELTRFLTRLENHYGVKPIIYTTQRMYRDYISGHFEDHPIWIRNVFYAPQLSDGRAWTFWQYSDRHRLQGYDGKEAFIDMNVFNGTGEALQAMLTGG